MNPALLKVLLVLAPTLLLLLATAALYVRTTAAADLVQALGAACLFVVVLAHLCEALNLLPFMGWGAKGSIGHYIDLASALLGVALLTIGSLARVISKRKAHAPNLSLNRTARRRRLRAVRSRPVSLVR